jgi:hypothetical protein
MNGKNFLNHCIVFNTNGETRCINCHEKDKVLMRIEWMLLCEMCLKRYIDQIKEEKQNAVI